MSRTGLLVEHLAPHDESMRSPEAAADYLLEARQWNIHAAAGKKCSDCPCEPGEMYEDIAIAVARHLEPSERAEVLQTWWCHMTGKRCMGAGQAVGRELKKMRGRQ